MNTAALERLFQWNDAVSGEINDHQLWLAGGLTHENVAEGIRRFRPLVVDTASGIESEPGIKDPLKMNLFREAVLGSAIE